MRAEVLKGHLDALLLAALDEGPRHGYAVKEALRETTAGKLDLPTGTIYPALHRLEQAGLISGTWSVVAGRRRRTYQLTGHGRTALADARQNWREFADVISSALKSAPWPATS
ncbi:PadR family transcriptional regulator [Acrocarpospora phusangensis]|uniref:PadR family transcriptional regulator n=1 Tax=Acrocarpospora phusangensis TaxID=1070424 RepID=A0A919QA30_9ACTN|nr:helix-turn-helix transcriptional regulator [Acrocarpospora phusangensis]GIH25319.1 PadR family transcriptional regulator [Acrocarpospora phusangensis]